MRIAAITVGALILLATACGGSNGSSAVDGGCFRMSQAVSDFNTSQDAQTAGTATTSDTAKSYASIKSTLDTAAELLPAGKLHDMAATSAVAVGRARVALLSGGDASADVTLAHDQLTAAAPLCKGHTP